MDGKLQPVGGNKAAAPVTANRPAAPNQPAQQQLSQTPPQAVEPKPETQPPQPAPQVPTAQEQAAAQAQAAQQAADPDVVVSSDEMMQRAEHMEKIMWVCPKDGGTTIINSADKPMDECVVADPSGQQKLQSYKGKPMRRALVEEQLKNSALQRIAAEKVRVEAEKKAELEALAENESGKKGKKGKKSKGAEASPSPTAGPEESAVAVAAEGGGDVYKCFDENGTPSYVNERQKVNFRHCVFWSRSYAAVKEDLKTNAMPKEAAENNRLHCSGAGSVTFRGEKKDFSCASRSFDYTPGTSGGEIRAGERSKVIAEHKMDYFAEEGHCGGTITAENGRVLHLEATKDCPAAAIQEAKRIEKEVVKALNINVSGEFRQRQRDLSAQVNAIANEVGVDPFFVHAIISAESAYKPKARSHAGAMGLMQLMPATARRFGVSDAYNTEQNIRAGSTYLKWLLGQFGSMELAAAGYNAGEGNVKKYGNKIPPFIETKAYVPKVMEYYRRYKASPGDIGL